MLILHTKIKLGFICFLLFQATLNPFFTFLNVFSLQLVYLYLVIERSEQDTIRYK